MTTDSRGTQANEPARGAEIRASAENRLPKGVRSTAAGPLASRHEAQERPKTRADSFARRARYLDAGRFFYLRAEHVGRFSVAPCRKCEGPLKPRVVFFGDNVPKPVVDAAFAVVDEAEALLVVGSSLAVFSGYRFVLRAARRGIPIVMVNLGSARGEELCAVKVDGKAGEVLPRVAELLGS